MTTKAKLGRGTIDIDGETYATDTFEFDGTVYTMRELSVDEGDDIWDMNQEPVDVKVPNGPTKTNHRMNTRMLLAKSLVEPTVAIDRVGRWGGAKYTIMLRHFNGLNTASEANPTPPAGSAGPTSPDGGSASPTT